MQKRLTPHWHITLANINGHKYVNYNVFPHPNAYQFHVSRSKFQPIHTGHYIDLRLGTIPSTKNPPNLITNNEKKRE
jgi:hypothetical protein